MSCKRSIYYLVLPYQNNYMYTVTYSKLTTDNKYLLCDNNGFYVGCTSHNEV